MIPPPESSTENQQSPLNHAGFRVNKKPAFRDKANFILISAKIFLMGKFLKRVKKCLKVLGPGFITGSSDDDPSGIATYAQTGARFGYNLLWASLFTLPLMVIAQEMCGRIGMVTGKGLSKIIREHYCRPLLYCTVALLFLANTVNIGADLAAMAASAQLIFPLPFVLLLLAMTFLTLFLEIFVPYKTYANYLKYLTISLFAYILAAFAVKQDWGKIAYATFIPTISTSKDYIINIVAFLGTTISPYLFFWQAGEEIEEEVASHKLKAIGGGKPKVTKYDINRLRADTFLGMFFSNLVTFFIIITAAGTLGTHGFLNIETADQAAQALRPLAGDLAFLLFAIGIIGTGLLAVPVLAGSLSYAMAEAFGFREGLYLKLKKAHGFYGVITLATLLGLLINVTPVKPFTMLYYAAILNGICAPPLLLLILAIGNNQKIMGKYTNSSFSNIVGGLTAGIMGLASILLLLHIGRP